MITLRKLLPLTAVGMSLLVSLSGTALAQTVDEIISRGKLLVANDTTTPPYGTIGDDMQPAGFDVDLAKIMAAELGVQVEFVPVNSGGRIPALLDGRADVAISILSVTTARAQQIWYSTPYSGETAVLFAAKDKSIAGGADLVGLKVGVVRGALEEGYITKLDESTPGIEILRFDDYASKLQALLSGQIDAAGGGAFELDALDERAANYEAKFPLRTNYFGIGMRRGATDLLQWTNTFLWTLKNDGRLEELSQKWRKTALPILPVF